jgi:hypothetical protein
MRAVMHVRAGDRTCYNNDTKLHGPYRPSRSPRSVGHREGDLESEQRHDFFADIKINTKICVTSSRTTLTQTHDIKLYDYIEL